MRGLEGFLAELREDLKARTFRPLPARRRAIPKSGGKVRYLGIATIRDRVAQASLKLVLEPIFEADFLPCSYGFRPNRRTHDAVAEVHHFASRSYEWVVEGDIKACFDEISHSALMNRVRERVGDKRVLDLVKAFLKAGILGEDGTLVDTDVILTLIFRDWSSASTGGQFVVVECVRACRGPDRRIGWAPGSTVPVGGSSARRGGSLLVSLGSGGCRAV
ncbi:reverse transcriptase domain-containing protein [Streptomyces atratus]|uniref:reverse transcriptase domain-containing protein n=1 Tax=Streptomyces atratus TaxID=1893 RepID=UPI00369214C0